MDWRATTPYNGRTWGKKKPAVSNAVMSVPPVPKPGKPSTLLDTRVVYCGNNLEQLAKLPDACVDLIDIDPPFNSNRTTENFGSAFWGETKEKRSFEDRHASSQASIDYTRPRCVQLARVRNKSGSFYDHCDGLLSANMDFSRSTYAV